MLSFKKGIQDGIPIGLGYLSISFAFGILAAKDGVSALLVTLMSATNLTSAGQLAGLTIIANCGTLAEIIVSMIIINARYFVMSLTITQKLDKSVTFGQKFLIAFGITDEIFAVSSLKYAQLTFRYMLGIMILPIVCWTGGTLLGATTGNLMPLMIQNPLNILLYGMLVAVIVPTANRSRFVAIAVFASIVMSSIIYYCFKFISSGWAVMICAISVSAFMAWKFPVEDQKEKEKQNDI